MKEFFKLSSLKIWKALVFSGAGALTLFVQIYFFPGAGVAVENKRSVYSFQSNYWANSVISKLNEIVNSGLYEKISITKARTLDDKYMRDVFLYQSQIRDMIRLMKYQSDVLVNLLSELSILMPVASPAVEEVRSKKIINNIEKLVKTLEYQKKFERDLAEFLPRLSRVFDGGDINLSETEKIEFEVERINTIAELYTKKEYMMKLDKGSLGFLNNFGEAELSIYQDYDFLVSKYNQKIEKNNTIKNAFLMSLALFAACILWSNERSKIKSYEPL